MSKVQKHLQGRHNQKDHGNRGTVVSDSDFDPSQVQSDGKGDLGVDPVDPPEDLEAEKEKRFKPGTRVSVIDDSGWRGFNSGEIVDFDPEAFVYGVRVRGTKGSSDELIIDFSPSNLKRLARKSLSSSGDSFTVFLPLTKIDETKREVWGFAAEEVRDKSGEIFDYESSKPHFLAWSDRIVKASGGRSRGNLRAMHQSIAAGKVIDLQFRDEDKKLFIGTKIVDDAEWKKVQEGVYTGFSIGGSYAKRWPDGSYMRYTADPTEISLVDNPAMYGATFELIKADGVSMTKAFLPKKKEKFPTEEEDPKEGEAPSEDPKETPPEKESETPEGESSEKPEGGSEEESAEGEVPSGEETPEGEIPGSAGASLAENEKIKAVVLEVLMDLGLVTTDNTLAMASRVEGLEKLISSFPKTDPAQITKRLEQSEAVLKEKLEKMTSDWATTLTELNALGTKLEEALQKGVPGPILREISDGPLQQQQILEKMISEARDPFLKDALRNQLAEISIKNIHKEK